MLSEGFAFVWRILLSTRGLRTDHVIVGSGGFYRYCRDPIPESRLSRNE